MIFPKTALCFRIVLSARHVCWAWLSWFCNCDWKNMEILATFPHLQDDIKVIRRYEGWYYTHLVYYYRIFYFETDWSRIRPLPSTNFKKTYIYIYNYIYNYIYMLCHATSAISGL